MDRPPQDVAEVYLTFLERAITGLRMRIRYGEQVSLDEVHDLMDALHNIPAMLRGAGEWFTEENITADLARYDQRWLGEPGSQLRNSLIDNLNLIRARE
ncbi:MAG TPA: hypothetical protein VFE24_14880 [Pirellulales bacterium]|jgi:hypothetical protein|nr:hypothetical protein [Pirellulales bacterium]